MKKWICVLVTLVCALSLTACGHEHVWDAATCEEPEVCSECGETQGEALGHEWLAANCIDPMLCSRCGLTQGEALGHEWTEATCTEPEMCTLCGQTNGVMLGHDVITWTVTKESTCAEEGEESGTCTRCDAVLTRGLALLEHTLGEWAVTVEATEYSAGERTQSCTVCGTVLAKEEFELSAEEIEAAYKEKCRQYTYDEIARNPDDYKGEYAFFKGEVIQVMEDGSDLVLRVDVTKGKYTWTDTILVSYTYREGESRILEDDIVYLYGMLYGTYTYETIFGASVTIPLLFAEYIELA